MTRRIAARLHGALVVVAALAGAALLEAQATSQGSAPRTAGTNGGTVPDFSGVWRTIAPPAAPRVNTTLRWLPAPGELPDFTPEYKKKYDAIQVSREAGSEETESVARCLPPGMPWFMGAQYGLEILQTRDKVGMFSEWMDAYRRVYLDGRKMPADFDPSYNGYSTGRWEGDTLVIETINLRGETELDRYGSPHSDRMRIVERMRLVEPNILEDVITVHDPVAFTKPWTHTRRYRRAAAGNDELHENTCTEGLKLAK
jgi:hypothetical protein